MPDYHTKGSHLIKIPKGKIPKARKLVESYIEAIYETDASVPEFEFTSDGLWLRDTAKNFEPDETTFLAAYVIEKLNLHVDPTIITWAYTCSRPVQDAFGGGGSLIIRGKSVIILDMSSQLQCISMAMLGHDTPCEQLVVKLDKLTEGGSNCDEIDTLRGMVRTLATALGAEATCAVLRL